MRRFRSDVAPTELVLFFAALAIKISLLRSCAVSLCCELQRSGSTRQFSQAPFTDFYSKYFRKSR
jgi:hypothetical protein